MPAGKLGRIRPTILPHLHARFLHLEDYLKVPALKPAPPAVSWWKSGMTPQMWLNNDLGDCTVAEAAGKIMLWSGNTSTQVIVSNATCLQVYSAISGYDPTKTNPVTGVNPTDTGCVLSDVMEYWQTKGIGGNLLSAYASIDPANINLVQWGIETFGGATFGLNCPESAITQSNANQPWTVVPGSPIDGGHAVAVYSYNQKYWNFLTWMQQTEMDYPFYEKYVEEVWIQVDALWLDEQGVSPPGLNLASLITNANVIGQ